MTESPPPRNAPLLVTALMGEGDQRWAEALRQAHFPPERNRVPAHITLFHHLPPRLADELRQRLKEEAAAARPPARITGLLSLGRGVAFRVESPALMAIRERLAEAFHGMLTPQDEAPPRFHITVQNKVAPAEARALHETLSRDFTPRPLVIAGLAVWRYMGGPWEPLSRHMFRG